MKRAPTICLLLTGCTLGQVDYTPCVSSADCQDAFGWGHRCGEEGLCEQTEQDPRCSRTVPDTLFTFREEYTDAIVVGSVYWTSLFPLETDALALAFNEVNEENALDGRPLALIVCSNDESASYDSLSQEEANEYVSRYLAEDIGVPAIVGPPTSAQTENTFNTVEPYETLVISPSATSPALTDLDGLSHSDTSPGLLWRTAPPDDLQGRVLAQKMAQAGVGKIAVIYETGPYGEGLAEVTKEESSATVQLFEFESETGRTQAVTDAATGYDAVLFISANKDDTTAFLNSAGSNSGYDDIEIFLPDGAFDTAIFAGATSADHLFDQITGTVPSTPSGSIFDFFKASFSASYGGADATQSGFTAHSYDASWLVIYGLAWAVANEDEISGTTIARGLRNVSDGESLDIKPTNWNTLKARFEAGQSVDVIGASGSLDYDPVTEETTAAIDVWEVNKDGTFRIIETIEP